MSTDPWNYPFPQRNQTMSLQTISKQDVGSRQLQVSRGTAYLDSTDIPGAQSILPGYKFYNKETFVNKVDDIDGCKVRQFNSTFTNKPCFVLKNDDIKGTKPQVVKFQTNRIPTNPLEPQYKIPYSEIRVPTPPKFIRDNIQVDDIEGTRAKAKYVLRKEVHQYPDVDGSHPKILFQPKDYIDSLKVKDINEMGQFKSTRFTNPLNPQYVHRDENNVIENIGQIKGNKSKELHPANVNKTQSFSLRTQDIPNAWADSLSNNFLRRDQRKDYRNPLVTQDIPGAAVGSLKKGIQSVRVLNPINPLNPKYQYPGEKEQFVQTVPEKFNIQKRENSVNPSQAQSQRQSIRSNGSQRNYSSAQRLDAFINK